VNANDVRDLQELANAYQEEVKRLHALLKRAPTFFSVVDDFEGEKLAWLKEAKLAYPIPLDRNGCIPAFTECPYLEACTKGEHPCNAGHQGPAHAVPFSCGFARAFKACDNIQKTKEGS